MEKISFIYFDLGGVVGIDFSGNDGWKNLQEELGVGQMQSEEFNKIFDEYEQSICTNMEVDAMKDILNKKLGLKIPDSYSLLMGFVSRFKQNPSIWPLLEDARKKYRIGLFTMMYPGMRKLIEAQKIVPDIKWDVIIDSSEIGFTKYDNEMFEVATIRANVPKNEILFVENSQKHIDTAKKYGWQTFLYNPTLPEQSNSALMELLSI